MTDCIDIKEAVRIATAHVSELYGEASKTPRLAEVELADESSHWVVTLEVADTHGRSAIEAMTGQDLSPSRKIVRIEAPTGRVVSIRSVD